MVWAILELFIGPFWQDLKAAIPIITKYDSTWYIGMTHVVLHYAHTFEICTFHFQFQSDPTSDINLIRIVTNSMYLINGFVVQFQQTYLKNQERYGDETLQKDWNPWQVMQEQIILFVNDAHIMIETKNCDN